MSYRCERVRTQQCANQPCKVRYSNICANLVVVLIIFEIATLILFLKQHLIDCEAEEEEEVLTTTTTTKKTTKKRKFGDHDYQEQEDAYTSRLEPPVTEIGDINTEVEVPKDVSDSTQQEIPITEISKNIE
ncbi:unnamed protein product [Phyllotreta striolata]|uniref:Uncharacterized protein n=1 Tax=Phyllotreta striolata TaxID=444603 RepID=A0A9N9TD33_PHYSR|nr:unnamed protein product [Phyllotreta striolata]